MKNLNPLKNLNVFCVSLVLLCCFSQQAIAQDGNETEATVCYDFDNCDAVSTDNADHDFSEFAPRTENMSDCIIDLDASVLGRRKPSENGHSCTEGVNNTPGMCVSARKDCDYSDNSDLAVRFSITVSPEPGEVVTLNGLSFFENAPLNFNWIDSQSGPNDYPQKYGVRVSRDGNTIFKQDEIPTTNDYSLEEFIFDSVADFEIEETATFEFEMMGYCPVDNGAIVSAWDLDDVKVHFGCRDDVPPPPPPVTPGVCCYDMEACDAIGGVGELADQVKYDEFVSKEDTSACGQKVICTPLYKLDPVEDPHSCTTGANGTIGLCINATEDCSFMPNLETALHFDITLNPEAGETITLDKLSFYEAAPDRFDWIDSADGFNNYPSVYGVRILRDGAEVFMIEDVPTTMEYTLQEYDLSGADFEINNSSTFTFQMLGYCTVANPDTTTAADPMVRVWDLDDIAVSYSCSDNVNMTDISGRAATNNNDGIANTLITLEGNGDAKSYMTDDNGNFIFQNNLMGESYILSASKDDDYLNGVSTIDLLLMQRHILGLQPLNDAHKVIAADVDNSKTVTATDLVELRKLILGIYDALPESGSWRFIDNEIIFPEANNPWSVSFDHEYRIPFLEGVMDIPLTGIKMGDVNNTATVSLGQTDIDTRSNQADLKLINTNNLVKLDLDSEAEAIQFELTYAGDINDIISINTESNLISTSNYFLNEAKGTIAFSWYEANTSLSGAFLSLSVTDNFDLQLLSIDESRIAPEVFNGNKSGINLVIENRAIEANNFIVTPNPFSNSLFISFESKEAGSQIDYVITNLSGSVVAKGQATTEKGLNQITIDQTTDITTGIYLLNIYNSETQYSQKIIKM